MTTVSGFFSRLTLRENVVLKPRQMDKNYRDAIVQILRRKYEGLCSHNGYILPGSIDLVDESEGVLRHFSLNGDTEFATRFTADVCCPCIGMIVRAKVVNINKLGIMLVVNDHTDHTVLEIIVVKGFDGAKMTSDIDKRLDDVQIGQEFDVEVLGRRFCLNDRKISIVGTIIFNDKKKDSSSLPENDEESNADEAAIDEPVDDDFMVDAGADSMSESSDSASEGDEDLSDDDVDDYNEDDDNVGEDNGEDKCGFSDGDE